MAKRSKGGHGAAKPSNGKHGRGWGYQGNPGPSHWGGLVGDYHLSGAGASQSPIDIAGISGAGGEPIEFAYRLTPLKTLHKGHTVELVYAPGSGNTVNGKRYALLQSDFHMPSEQMVNGRHAAMEVHFVHQAADGELAVVGAPMDAGAENMALRSHEANDGETSHDIDFTFYSRASERPTGGARIYGRRSNEGGAKRIPPRRQEYLVERSEYRHQDWLWLGRHSVVPGDC